MTDQGEFPNIAVDGEAVETLAAASGLILTPQRARDLVPALESVLEADARLAELDITSYPAIGLPWAYASEESEA